MADEFLTTRWSLVLTAAGGDSRAQPALEQLCGQVWRPLYAFVRRWGHSREDAEDAVQGFLASVLARRSLDNVQQGRAKFRSYLLAGMKHYLADENARSKAAKRGAGAVHLSIDAEDAERGYFELLVDCKSPESAFDRVWAMDVMAKCRQQLGEECALSGKAAVFDALFPMDGAGEASYASVGARLGMSETALRSMAMRLRRRWRDLIRAELAQTVTTREALEEEMAALREALA